MIWVGGSIIVHGVHDFGLHLIGDVIHDAPTVSGAALGGVAAWIVKTMGYAAAGIVVGAVIIPVVGYLISRTWTAIKEALPGAKAAKALLLSTE
jgi:predicted DNA repair protein MutK